MPQKMSEARRTLGVRIAPDGNNKAKARHLTEVAMEWGKISWGRIKPAMAEYCICNIVYCKLMYPLAVTTLTQNQCTEVLRPLLVAGLPAVGYMRVFPQAVIHRPPSRQGIQFPNLYVEQTI